MLGHRVAWDDAHIQLGMCGAYEPLMNNMPFSQFGLTVPLATDDLKTFDACTAESGST